MCVCVCVCVYIYIQNVVIAHIHLDKGRANVLPSTLKKQKLSSPLPAYATWASQTCCRSLLKHSPSPISSHQSAAASDTPQASKVPRTLSPPPIQQTWRERSTAAVVARKARDRAHTPRRRRRRMCDRPYDPSSWCDRAYASVMCPCPCQSARHLHLDTHILWIHELRPLVICNLQVNLILMRTILLRHSLREFVEPLMPEE